MPFFTAFVHRHKACYNVTVTCEANDAQHAIDSLAIVHNVPRTSIAAIPLTTTPRHSYRCK